MNGELLFVIYYGGMVSLLGILMNQLVKRGYQSSTDGNVQDMASQQID